MPYSIHWYIENEIIYSRFWGVTAADEFRESLITISEMIESSPRNIVHVITDPGDVTVPLSPKDSLKIVREIGSPEKTGWNVLIREKSMLIKMSVAFGTSVFKMRNKTCDTMEDAVAFLKDIDSALSWDKADESVVISQ